MVDKMDFGFASKKCGIAFIFSIILSLTCFADAKSSVSDSLACNATEKNGSPVNGAMIYRVGPDVDYAYTRPRSFSFITNFPRDMGQYFKNTFQKTNLLKIGAVVAGTGILIAFDQPIVDNAQKLARRWHIPSDNRTKALFYVGKFPFNVPNSTGSVLYYIGDGTTHCLIAGSFLAYGFFAKDNRALQTASQMAEGMITVGTVVQILKHATGRETPARTTAPGGVWRLFPNQMEYLDHVSKYDAFPSGHLATAMMCVTVIAGNYPEHAYIRPLGYALMTVVGFQMLNNGVHWASDYPLGIAIGYSFGKIILARGHATIDRKAAQTRIGKTGLIQSVRFYPVVTGNTGFGIAVYCGF